MQRYECLLFYPCIEDLHGYKWTWVCPVHTCTKCIVCYYKITVYWKSTHPYIYLHKYSHHHPAQKRRVMLTLLQRAWWIADQEHWEEKHRYLKDVFRKNGFSMSEINRSFVLFDSNKWRARNASEEEPTRGVMVVPFYQTITSRLAYFLQHKQLHTISYPYKKLK